MRDFLKEFKEFISRGNVVDLAIAVIIGAAFGAIVTALTNQIIMPLVNWVLALCGGKEGLESAYTILSAAYDENGLLDLTKSIYIDWGAFISAIINFLIIAFTVFCIVKIINKANKGLKKAGSNLKEQNSKEVREEKKAAKLQAKQENRSYKEVLNERKEQKKKEAEEKAKLEAEEKAKKEAEEKANNPTQEELLKQIKELLKENLELKNKK